MYKHCYAMRDQFFSYVISALLLHRTFQSQLPASGVTPNVSRQPMQLQMSHQRIENYIATRIVVNWKFWIVSFMLICVYTLAIN